jgi:hypothetical protein
MNNKRKMKKKKRVVGNTLGQPASIGCHSRPSVINPGRAFSRFIPVE